MKNIDEIINELNKNTNYEEIVCKIIKSIENNPIKIAFTEINENKHLSKEQKEKIYNILLKYTEEIGNNFKNKTETIYIKGFKEGTVTSLILNKISKNNLEKKDVLLDSALNDFIITRLHQESTLEENTDYIKNKNKINIIKKNVNKETLKIIEELEDCYAYREDLYNIEAYIIGFKDSIKLLYKPNDEE